MSAAGRGLPRGQIMRLEELLMAQGVVQASDLERAAERRQARGGPLADSLLALRLVTLEQLNAVLQMTPPALPGSVAETGIGRRALLALLLKTLHNGGADNIPALAGQLRLSSSVVGSLVEEAIEQKLLKVTGSNGRTTMPVLTYSFTETGREAVGEALQRSRYVGPAPVSLQSYIDQVNRQRLRNERAKRDRIRKAFDNLVVTSEFVKRIGPAVNAGRSILLYGPPGNGKSSIAQCIGRVFTDVIYIPYAVEVEGQIVKVFDSSIHEEIAPPGIVGALDMEIRREEFDRRWVACRRPVIVTGGEFTLEMLDLRYNAASNFYDAPLHLKALGGTFVIDDFGRQAARPTELLNRWIVPLEERVDYLRLQTGATFSVPFDELVIFSTNLKPDSLMDPAFLRRIPYKIELSPPSQERYREIFRLAAAERGLQFSDAVFAWLVEELEERRQLPLACYQPRFIVDQIVEACAFDESPPLITESSVAAALDNLYTTGPKNRALAAA